MIIQLEVTNEEAAFFAHLLDLGVPEQADLSTTLRVAPAFLHFYASRLVRLVEEYAYLFNDYDLERLMVLWSLVDESAPPSVEALRMQSNS